MLPQLRRKRPGCGIVALAAMLAVSCGGASSPYAEWPPVQPAELAWSIDAYCASADGVWIDHGYNGEVRPARLGEQTVIGVDRAGFSHRLWLRFPLPEGVSSHFEMEVTLTPASRTNRGIPASTGLAEPVGSPRPFYDPAAERSADREAESYVVSLAAERPERSDQARIIAGTSAPLLNSYRDTAGEVSAGEGLLWRQLTASWTLDRGRIFAGGERSLHVVVHSDARSFEPMIAFVNTAASDRQTPRICIRPTSGTL